MEIIQFEASQAMMMIRINKRLTNLKSLVKLTENND